MDARQALAIVAGVVMASATTIGGMVGGFVAGIALGGLLPAAALGEFGILAYLVLLLLLFFPGGALGLFIGYQIHFWLRHHVEES